MRRLGSAFGSVVFAAGALAAAGVPAQAVSDDPPAGSITIKPVTFNGSGCNRSNTTVNVAPDGSAVTFAYAEFEVRAPGTAAEANKDCNILLDITYPRGYTYAVVGHEYRGEAVVESGAAFEHRARYFFQGTADATWERKRYDGPVSESWQASHKANSVVWAPCRPANVYLHVNSSLKAFASASGAKATATMETSDHSVSSKIHLDWKECTE